MNFTYTKENIPVLETALSLDRLTKYVRLAEGNKEKTLELYTYNTRLSESLYTPIQGLEVCVRNAVGERMRGAFGDDWYEAGKAPLQYPLTAMIDKAKDNLDTKHKIHGHGGMVSELNFGFWVTILSPRYDDPLWRSTLRHAFPHRPKGQERKQVHNALNSIRRLRNRVAHHEPILHRDLEGDHNLIQKIIGWTCADTAEWVKSQSRFAEVYSN